MVEEVAKSVAGQTDGLLTEVYKDLLQPAVRPVGKLISYPTRLIGIAFSSIEKWFLRKEEVIKLAAEEVRKKLKDIPEEKIVPLEPNVAVPAIMQLSYCEDNEQLRDLYANLLASSMNIDTKWKIHPAYVDIIKQLTPDEAKLLSDIPNTTVMNHGLIDVQYEADGGFYILIDNFTNVCQDVLDNPIRISEYITNLYRLGIIDIPSRYYLKKDVYASIKSNQLLQSYIKDNFGNDLSLSYDEKTFKLTDFGVGFKSVCCMQDVVDFSSIKNETVLDVDTILTI